MIDRLLPAKRTRAPFELGCRPLPSSMTPALTNSSLNFAMAPSSSSDGIFPASESFDALTITMNRIVVLLLCALTSRAHPSLYRHVERPAAKTTCPVRFILDPWNCWQIAAPARLDASPAG